MSGAKRVLILGSTGSIGTQALDVCSRSDELEVVGLSAENSWEALLEQARALGVRKIALADTIAAARASEAWTDGVVMSGAEGLVRLVVESGADLVLNALVGSAGLGPTVATLGEGIDLALANKESLVVGGELVDGARRGDRRPDRARRLRAHRPAPADRGPARRLGGPHDDHRQRRAVPGPQPRGARRGERAGGPRAPDVGDGREDHDRLGDAHEQGP